MVGIEMLRRKGTKYGLRAIVESIEIPIPFYQG
jgi:hypothetical protein